MSTLKVLLIIAPLAMATAAAAAPDQFTDAQYIAAARCQGLMSSTALGKEDMSQVDAVMKAQSKARSPAVFDRADEARDNAQRAANHAGAYSKAGLIAERDGSCQAILGGGAVSASIDTHGTTRTN